jgi:carbonic anhydrase/acetyltransferase-like protein (isoleucine patch superfamily)
MKAFCLNTATNVAPFGGPVGEMAIGGLTLAEVQNLALVAAGFERVDTPPSEGAYLLFSDRTWFTSDLLRQLAGAGPGRLRVLDEGWQAWTKAQQKLEEPGLYELGICEGAPSFEAMKPLDLALEFHEMALGELHPSFSHAVKNPIRMGAAMVHQIDHWSHLVRVNQLSLGVRMEEARADWDGASFVGKAWRLFKILLKARSLNGWKIAASLSEYGKNTTVHPTAVVEFSVLMDGCEIGPHAVVRGSVIGEGAVVDSHAVVNASSMGAGSKVGRFGHINLCTLFAGSMVSTGDGFQVSVFGRDSFVAWGATVLDLSFGSPIKVEVDGGGRESVGHHFLGAAIGHRAKIGHGVKIGYGVAIPNDVLLVDKADVLTRWGDGPLDQPAIVRDGVAVARKP